MIGAYLVKKERFPQITKVGILCSQSIGIIWVGKEYFSGLFNNLVPFYPKQED